MTELHFLLRESIEVMPPRKLDRWRMRREGLHNNLSFEIPAARAAGDLRDELKRSLAGAEIRHMQAEVRVEDADKGDVGKMKSLGDHLGAYQNIDLVGFEGVERISQRVFPPHRVRIDACDLGAWQDLGDEFLHFLGSVSLEDDGRVPAFRTFFRNNGLVPADMTNQPLVRAVISQSHGAVRALANVAALRALQGPRETTPVQEKDRLLAVFQTLLQRGPQLV